MNVNEKFESFDQYTQNAIVEFVRAMDRVFPNLFSHEELLTKCINNLDGNIEIEAIPGSKGVYNLESKKMIISPILFNAPLYEKLTLFHEFIHVITRDLLLEKRELCGLFELFTTLCEEKYYTVLTGRKNVKKVNGYIVDLARPFELIYGEEFLHSFLKGDRQLQDFIYVDPILSSIPIENIKNVYKRRILNNLALYCDNITHHLLHVPSSKLDDSKIASSVFSLESLFLEQLKFKGLSSKDFLETLNKLYTDFRFPNDSYVVGMIRKYCSNCSEQEILSILLPYKELYDLFQISILSFDEVKEFYRNLEENKYVLNDSSKDVDSDDYNKLLLGIKKSLKESFSDKVLFSLYLRFSGIDFNDIKYSFDCGESEKYSLLFEQKKYLRFIAKFLLTDGINFDKDSDYKIFFNQKHSKNESINLQQGNTKDSFVLGFFDDLFSESGKVDFLIYNTTDKKVEFIYSDILFSRASLEDVISKNQFNSLVVKEFFKYISSLSLNQPFFSLENDSLEFDNFEYPIPFFDVSLDGRIIYYEITYDKESNKFSHESVNSKFRYGKSIPFHLNTAKEKLV